MQRQADDLSVAERQAPPPLLTERQREVLIAVMRPLVADPFGQSASIAEIAREMWVSDAAVKRHLVGLYRKFGVDGRGAARQARLATALQRGAITVSEVQLAARSSQHSAPLGLMKVKCRLSPHTGSLTGVAS